MCSNPGLYFIVRESFGAPIQLQCQKVSLSEVLISPINLLISKVLRPLIFRHTKHVYIKIYHNINICSPHDLILWRFCLTLANCSLFLHVFNSKLKSLLTLCVDIFWGLSLAYFSRRDLHLLLPRPRAWDVQPKTFHTNVQLCLSRPLRVWSLGVYVQACS